MGMHVEVFKGSNSGKKGWGRINRTLGENGKDVEEFGKKKYWKRVIGKGDMTLKGNGQGCGNI